MLLENTVIDGKEIKQGNIMGLGDKTIHCVGEDVKDTTIELVQSIVDDESELISLYIMELL